ncbi:hypothetical protein [Acidiphilium sp. 20-67-58]|uniref:hypothetical protein n=1 Tax=Acidiphilium sp. 20-67-58 TaxID=1970291 RepID=UPI0025BEE21D|nr:hypothetical protein [Acidiphilium sp. 20-67-58]
MNGRAEVNGPHRHHNFLMDQKKWRHLRAAKFREETSKKANRANVRRVAENRYSAAVGATQELFCSAASQKARHLQKRSQHMTRSPQR